MTWVLIAQRWPPALLASAVSGVLAGVLRGKTAPVPSLSQGVIAPVPVLAVLAIVPVVAVLWGWSGLPASSVVGAVRPVAFLLVPLLVTVPVVFIAGSVALGSVGALLEGGRDAVGLLGLAVIGMRCWGDRGALLSPLGYVTAAFVAGCPSGSPTSYPWAWILRDGGDLSALLIAVGTAAVGVAVIPGLAARIAMDR